MNNKIKELVESNLPAHDIFIQIRALYPDVKGREIIDAIMDQIVLTATFNSL